MSFDNKNFITSHWIQIGNKYFDPDTLDPNTILYLDDKEQLIQLSYTIAASQIPEDKFIFKNGVKLYNNGRGFFFDLSNPNNYHYIASGLVHILNRPITEYIVINDEEKMYIVHTLDDYVNSIQLGSKDVGFDKMKQIMGFNSNAVLELADGTIIE